MEVSVYKNFKNKIDHKNIIDVLYEIKSNLYEKEIISLRTAIKKSDFTLAEKLKKALIAFTPSATFFHSRTIGEINKLSSIVCIDYDDLPIEEIDELCIKINRSTYTFSSFISPSGNGIKIFVKVNSTIESYQDVYKDVSNYYNALIGYENDTKCKDITRLCFVSYDPNIYINKDAIQYKITIDSIENVLKVAETANETNPLDKCLKFTERNEKYFHGNRNNFIYLFSCNANRFGINENDTYEYCITNFDLDEIEIKRTIRNVYKMQIADFAKFANCNLDKSPNKKNTTANTDDCDFLLNTPTIPNEVYDNLPPILYESCNVFTNPREKDTFLTGAIAILSGCLPNVKGLYGGSTVYPNLFAFILAPAASGKGVLKHAKNLANKYHKSVIENSREQKKQYDEALATYKLMKNKNPSSDIELPKEPKYKVVFIPANTSNAKIIQHLECNDGKGIICETEADTLGQTFKNDWGSYSDMLRKAFHHEKISISRKTNSEFVEIDEGKISVALSGTPNQIINIISSAEDGLSSRFMYYAFKTKNVWSDQSPNGNPINLTDFFQLKSIDVYKMVEYFENDKMNFQLTDEQWKRHTSYFESLIETVSIFTSEDAISLVKRFGLIFYRICMIFSAIRKFKNNSYEVDVFCLDIDFESTLKLIKVYVEHSVFIFNNLPKNANNIHFKAGNNKQMFFDELPNNFTRKEAISLGVKHNLKERSVDSFLKDCLGNFLRQPSFGTYEKIKKN